MATRQEVETFVKDSVAPLLQRDGGDIELVDFEEPGKVKVRLQGACATCPHAQMTLKMGVERMLKENLDGIEEVIAV